MLKVFLVEDEFSVRERIKKNINWEANGFSLVGEAGDGELAYPMIQQEQPDIIITDIKMPFMDGLQLSKLVKDAMPEVKIIILSGYDEFDYAQKAISIGITDYLLKPITPKKLLESLNQVANIIHKEREKKASYEIYRLEQYEKELISRKKFFNHMVTSSVGAKELIEEAQELGINLTAGMYNILLLKENFTIREALIEHKSIAENLRQQIARWLETCEEIIGFDRDTEGWALLLKGTSSRVEELEKEVIMFIEQILDERSYLSYCIGVGQRVTRLSEIAKSFSAANKALAYYYLVGNERVIYYEALDEYKLSLERDKMSISQVELTKNDKKMIEAFARSGLKEQVGIFVEEYLKRLEKGVESYLFRQYIVMDIYFDMKIFAESLGYEGKAILEAYGDMADLQSVIKSKDQMRSYLEKLLLRAISMREEVSGNKYHALIEEAKYYIQQNYNKESISLNIVAEYVHISPNHLSTLFSQETGQTFISYLTEIRMKKAKELLKCSAMKTLEIGYEVGYKDPHYFSQLFKRTQNCTPKEYRKSEVL